jgi:hypothetical protein
VGGNHAGPIRISSLMGRRELPSDWGCGGEQGMTGRVFGWLGIRNGVGFASGGDWGRWVEPKR